MKHYKSTARAIRRKHLRVSFNYQWGYYLERRVRNKKWIKY